MSLNLFRRLDRYDRRIRQLERTEPPEGGGGGGDHADSDHADAFSPLAHTHAVHADSDHDDRFSLLAHTHAGVGAHTHDWVDVTGEPATFPPTPQLLDWLTDVATAGQTTTNVLTYNGSAWVPSAIPAQAWTSITGKPSTFPPDEHDTAHDDRFSQLAHFHTLESLTDVVDVTAPITDGYVLTWATTIWRAMAPTAVAHTHDTASNWVSAAGSYGTGWGATGGVDQAPRYRFELTTNGDVVRLDGAATRSSGTNTTIFTLPIQYRPNKIKRFWTPGGGTAQCRIAVDTDGTVSQTAGADFTRTSLEGCTFPIT